jgi:2-polyprenyl-3-methyl-5-hydroxy-6-metoxy-1,4-benzoquinol methylase
VGEGEAVKMGAIGGHKAKPYDDGPGLDVIREAGGIVKIAHTPGDLEGIRNEARMLRLLSGSGFAPELIDEKEDRIIEEDLGEGEPIQDGEAFRRNCVRLLWALQQVNIRHGDLTGANIIVKADRPMAIDFQQSNLYSEGPPQKRPLSDSYFLWRFAANSPAEQHPTPDTPRVIRRWLAVLGSLGGLAPDMPLRGKMLLDLGCFQGDFCAMAAAEGMRAHGIDTGGFNPVENSLERAAALWESMLGTNIGFAPDNILGWPHFDYDVVLLFSTWSYVLNDYGKERAFDLLARIVGGCGVLFFETQLAGDGPGPDFLVTDDDVANMLGQFGVPEPLVTIPVTGRPASRTVWKVTRP